MSRFRFVYGSHDFGWQRHICVDYANHRQCVRFTHNPKYGCRKGYMQKMLKARKALQRWIRDEHHIRSRARLKFRTNHEHQRSSARDAPLR